MKKQLKGYIPLGAPLIWEEVAPNEPKAKTMIGFTTNWFAQRTGADFSERFHKDPEYRFETILKMKKYIYERFPESTCFREHDQDSFEQECATISNVYGVCLVAMLYDLEPVYFPNNWPAIHPKQQLSVEQVMKLKPIDVENHPVVQQLFEQMDYIERKWGKIDGYLNFQGVLNNAFKLRGANIFEDMIEDPEMCHFLLEHVTDTMIQLAKLVQKRQCDSGFHTDCFCTSNCVVNMISPQVYHEFVLPHDKRLAKEFAGFGIHSCNWVLDPYVKEFSSIENMGYIDFGAHSNLKLVREYFPDCRRVVFYDPTNLIRKPEEEVRTDIFTLYRDAGPCDVCLPDIDLMIPDEKVQLFERISREAIAEMYPD